MSSIVDARAREGMDGAGDGTGTMVGDAGGSTNGKGGSTGAGGAKDGGGSAGTSGVGGKSGTAGSSGGTGGGSATGGSGAAGGSGGSTTTASIFPVVYSANSRYLQDKNGTPFPIMGRTAWFVISLSPADYKTFLNDTVSRGYNAIEMHVLDHDPRGNKPPFNGNGDAPFLKQLDGNTWNGSLTSSSTTSMPDFTTPNLTYWAYVDTFLAACESSGILVFFFPSYVGASGTAQGWSAEMVANGNAKMKTFGAFVANRYKAQKNLVWMLGGDMGTAAAPFSQAQTDAESGLIAGIQSVTGLQSLYYSAEWASESIGTDQTNFGSAISLNGAYAWTGDVNTEGRLAYAHTPVIPSFLLEEPYDEEGPDGTTWNSTASQPVRRYQWWGWLSTIGGYISGNGYVWPFNPTGTPIDSDNWRNHLNTQGAQDMARLNAFMKSFTWWQLVPSGLGGMKNLVTAGAGVPTDHSYVAAAATPTGTLLIAYVPPEHTGSITIDMTAMSGVSRARWYNPTTAVYTVIGSSYANTGTQAFTPPGDNGSGFTDWVLVIDKP